VFFAQIIVFNLLSALAFVDLFRVVYWTDALPNIERLSGRIRMRPITVALATAAIISSLLVALEPTKEAKPDRTAELIKQLGDDKFTKREAATKELKALGEPALPALQKAATSSKDAEIRLRASRLVDAIEADGPFFNGKKLIS